MNNTPTIPILIWIRSILFKSDKSDKTMNKHPYIEEQKQKAVKHIKVKDMLNLLKILLK